MPPDLDDVLDRLGRLEQQNAQLRRRYRRLQCAGLIGVVWVVSLGLSSCSSKAQPAAIPRSLDVEKLTLTGADGKRQALLASGPNGPTLILFAPTDPPTPLIGLSADAEHGASVSLYDRQGKGRIQLKVARDGEAVLAMTNEREKERARLSVGGPGPGLTLWDDADRTRVVLTTVSTSSGLTLFGADRSAIFLDNSPDTQRLMFLNSKEVPRIGLAVTKQGPALGLFDEQGRELFTKP